jgi:hypothetical protein
LSAVKNVSERDFGEAGRHDGASKDQQQGAQKAPKPAQEQAEVVAGGGEHGVDAVAFAALEKAAARSQLKLAIEDALDSGLPRAHTPDLYRQKCPAVFGHVYESPNGMWAFNENSALVLSSGTILSISRGLT